MNTNRVISTENMPDTVQGLSEDINSRQLLYRKENMQERVYLLSLETVSEEETAHILNNIYLKLDEERRLYVEKIKHKRKRLESAAAGLLLQLAIQEAHGQSRFLREGEGTRLFTIDGLLEAAGRPFDLKYIYGSCGKPYLKNYPYFFSLSHSADYVLCAFSEREIGADIQQEKECSWERIAERCFTKEEMRKLVRRGMKEERKSFFYERWCRKEAYGKLTGKGMTASMGKNVDDLAHWIEVQGPQGYRIAACVCAATDDTSESVKVKTGDGFSDEKITGIFKGL